MSNEADHIAILTEAYQKYRDSKGGSVDHLLSIVAPDVQFGSIARGAAPLTFAKQYTNRDALKEYFEGLQADWSMVDYVVEEFVAQGDAVVMRGSCAYTNKRTGKTAETPKLDFWRFKDGKAVEFYEFFDTARVALAAT